jgi:hypothetical protein
MTSDVPARLGPKAPALAWLWGAPALRKPGPGQSRHWGLGSGPARPKPRLLGDNIHVLHYKKVLKVQLL